MNSIKKIRKVWRNFLRLFGRKMGSEESLLTDDVVQRYVYCHRRLQVVIAIVSDYRAGTDVKSKDYLPKAIFKAEGGVTVDNKEIVITRIHGVLKCYNDWDDKDMETPAIVKEVIEEIFKIKIPLDKTAEYILVEYAAENTNVPRDILWRKIDRFVSHPYGGDSLYRLFRS